MELQKQYHQNCTAYIAAYAVMGIINGLIYDVLVTYLMLVSPSMAKSVASFMGAATFGAAAIAVLAPKVGYKRLLQLAAVSILAALLAIPSLQNPWLLGMGLLLLITGTTLFDVMLPPFIAAYTTASSRAATFTKVSFAGTLGLILGTSMGGPLVIWLFSRKLHETFAGARALTALLDKLQPAQYTFYIDSYRAIIMVFAALSLLMLGALSFIKEVPGEAENAENPQKGRYASLWGLFNRYALVFLVYSALARFTSALIVPQVSVYLTKLGLNRAAVSVMGTLQYVAILAFMLFSIRIVQKFGQVYTIVGLTFASVPFILILANGNHLGSHTALVVGIALFFRAGLSNAVIPAVNALTMELVPQSSRALYSSLVFVVQSVVQVLAGLFASFFLFSTDSGYANAYYYAAVLYVIAHVLLLLFFGKRRSLPQMS